MKNHCDSFCHHACSRDPKINYFWGFDSFWLLIFTVIGWDSICDVYDYRVIENIFDLNVQCKKRLAGIQVAGEIKYIFRK